MTSIHRERGITLVTALIMLVLLTLVALTTFNVGKSNLQIVSNMQQRDEATAAAREVLEEVISRNTQLDLAKEEDLVCSMGSTQSFGVTGAVDGNSACADSVWEINAVATDMETEAEVQVTQGVAVRVARDDVTNTCPTT